MSIAISHEATTEGWRLFKDKVFLVAVLHNTHDCGRTTVAGPGSREVVGVRDLLPTAACQLYFTNPCQNYEELKAVVAHVEEHELALTDPAHGWK